MALNGKLRLSPGGVVRLSLGEAQFARWDGPSLGRGVHISKIGT
jgi:hypothetical protein